ncbi:MAG: hypothetical protein LUD72_07805 [Bacteroidales bacterium]|nr:hypothetical protein [Bacteroidales bacterium]
MTCDLAETYGVMDMRELPVPLLATLASGLGENSRIMMKISGRKVTNDQLVAAMTADATRQLVWLMTGARAKKRTDPPESLVDILLGREKKKMKNKDGLTSFSSSEEFNAAWKRLAGSDNDG